MADIFGIPVLNSPLDSEFQFSAATFLKNVTEDAKVLFLCSPNNPTGNLLDEKEILMAAREWCRPVVVDEAYVEFSSRPSLCRQLEQYGNLVIMRTFSKAFGCAGLRLGYVLAAPDLIDTFMKVKAPYNLNSFTQEAGIQALQELGVAAGETAQILEERERIAQELRKLSGIERLYSSDANFLLFRCKGASKVCRDLLASGIVVRDRSTVPGLRDSIRVTIGTPEENSLFLKHLKVCLEGGAT
jgi:histidinol-phosphate aminotransferase